MYDFFVLCYPSLLELLLPLVVSSGQPILQTVHWFGLRWQPCLYVNNPRYMYIGTIDDLNTRSPRLLEAADKYQLAELKEICEVSKKLKVIMYILRREAASSNVFFEGKFSFFEFLVQKICTYFCLYFLKILSHTCANNF